MRVIQIHYAGLLFIIAFVIFVCELVIGTTPSSYFSSSEYIALVVSVIMSIFDIVSAGFLLYRMVRTEMTDDDTTITIWKKIFGYENNIQRTNYIISIFILGSAHIIKHAINWYFMIQMSNIILGY